MTDYTQWILEYVTANQGRTKADIARSMTGKPKPTIGDYEIINRRLRSRRLVGIIRGRGYMIYTDDDAGMFAAIRDGHNESQIERFSVYQTLAT